MFETGLGRQEQDTHTHDPVNLPNSHNVLRLISTRMSQSVLCYITKSRTIIYLLLSTKVVPYIEYSFQDYFEHVNGISEYTFLLLEQ